MVALDWVARSRASESKDHVIGHARDGLRSKPVHALQVVEPTKLTVSHPIEHQGLCPARPNRWQHLQLGSTGAVDVDTTRRDHDRGFGWQETSGESPHCEYLNQERPRQQQ